MRPEAETVERDGTQTPTCANSENVRIFHIWRKDTTVPLTHVNTNTYVLLWWHARRSVIFRYRCMCVCSRISFTHTCMSKTFLCKKKLILPGVKLLFCTFQVCEDLRVSQHPCTNAQCLLPMRGITHRCDFCVYICIFLLVSPDLCCNRPVGRSLQFLHVLQFAAACFVYVSFFVRQTVLSAFIWMAWGLYTTDRNY